MRKLLLGLVVALPVTLGLRIPFIPAVKEATHMAYAETVEEYLDRTGPADETQRTPLTHNARSHEERFSLVLKPDQPDGFLEALVKSVGKEFLLIAGVSGLLGLVHVLWNKPKTR
jgi:hypothetical protein